MLADEEDEEIVVLEVRPPGFMPPDAEIINVDEDSTTVEKSAANEKMEESQSFMNDIREHLNTVLNEWTKCDQGEQGYDTIRSWLSLTPEDVKSVTKKSKTKGEVGSENPSSSSYIQLIDKFAALFIRSYGQNKDIKEEIVNICLEHHDYILAMIKEFVNRWETQQNSEEDSKADSQGDHSAKDNETSQVATSKKSKRESESTLKAPSTKKESMGAAVNADMVDTIPGPEKGPTNISEEEKMFLDNLPEEVKQMFRQICFAKWAKDWLPVLVLNPYDVSQEEFREEWKKKYTKYSEPKSNKIMEHLFIWYGFKNASKAYGWAKDKELISYAQAKEKELHVVPKRITEKQTSGKTLTKGEQQIIDGFFEAEKALELTVADRFNRASEQADEENTEEEAKKDDESENRTIRTITRKSTGRWAALKRKSTGRCAPRMQLATKAIASKKDTQAVSKVSPASSSENFQPANPAVSHESTSVAQPRKRSYQEIKKDFEEADAALLQARKEGNERRIQFFAIAYDVLIEELKSIRQN